MRKVRLPVSSFRVCLVAVTCFFLRALAVVLPTRVAEWQERRFCFSWLCCLFCREELPSGRCRIYAFLPTSVSLTIVAERSEVGIKNASIILKGVSALFGEVCVLVAIYAVTSVMAEC